MSKGKSRASEGRKYVLRKGSYSYGPMKDDVAIEKFPTKFGLDI